MAKTPVNPKYLDVSVALEAQINKGRWDGGKMPSVRGIALQHQVSVVTASRALQVLRDKGLIQTVDRTGCFRVPPPSADRWALVMRLTPGPWQKCTLSNTYVGFEALARRDPMHLEPDLFPVTPATPDRELAALVRRAKELGVGGLFLLPSRHSEQEMQLDERLLACCDGEDLPVVLMERNLRGYNRPLEHDLVAVDDIDGATRATRHLQEIGRKRVAVVVASPTSSHDDRVAGYLFALHAAARHTGRKTVEHKPTVLYQSDDLPTREAYSKLADQILALDVDGVVCYQDYTAMGVIVELLTRGRSVPKDVAVVGSDDLPIGDQFKIGVTTYSYPSVGLAEQAVRLMRDRVKHPGRAPIRVVVPGKLIIRESTVPREK
ncbi:MAG TPA: substrate-binding domain-containing protein [Gemmataceae bacterium]|nr:substrate-binding domain-containing protein [Gemmataceae bacterium]